MDKAETIARIQRRYRVSDEALAGLFDHLQAHAQSLLGDDMKFRGRVRSAAQPDVELDFESFSDFRGHIGPDVSGFHLDLSTPWPDRSNVSIWLSRKSGPLEVTVTIKTPRLEEARAAIARLEEAAGLVLHGDKPEPGAAEATVQLTRRYFCKTPAIERWLTLFEAELAPLIQPSTFRARIKAAGEDFPEHEYASRAALLAAVPAVIGRVQFSADAAEGPYASVGMDFGASYQPALRIRAHFRSKDQARVKAALDRVEAALDLRRATDDDEGARDRIGPQVTCFARGTLDREWFQRLCAEFDRREPWPRWFSGHVRQRPDQSEATSYSSFAHWRDAAIQNWANLTELSAELDGQSFNLFVHLEPKLDFVRIRVRARSEAEAGQVLQELLQQFDLERQEAEPYSAARTTREFRIDPWNRVAFADAVKTAVDQFVGRDPVILPRDTYIAESDGREGEVLTRFSELAAFMKRLVDDKPIVGAGVLAKGPKGRILSLAVTGNCTRLVVRSGLEPGQFSDLVQALEKRLSLSAPKAEAAESSDGGFWRQFWRLKGLPGHIATLLAGGVVTAIGFLAVNAIPSYEIELKRPFARDGSAVSVEAGCVQVSWVVTQKQWPYQGNSLEGEPGELHLGPAGGSALPPVESFRSGQEMHIPPGRWTLYVSDTARKTVGPVIEIEAQDVNYTDKRAGIVARCGNPPAP